MPNSITFDNIIDIYNELGVNDSKIFIAPNIPQKKLNNVISSYAPNTNPNDIFILVDDTVFGSAKDGFIITSNRIIIHEQFNDQIEIKFSDIKTLNFNGSNLIINGNKVFSSNMPDKKEIIKIYNLLSNLLLTDNNEREQNHYESKKTNTDTNNENQLEILIDKIWSNNYFALRFNGFQQNKGKMAGLSLGLNILQSIFPDDDDSDDFNSTEYFYMMKILKYSLYSAVKARKDGLLGYSLVLAPETSTYKMLRLSLFFTSLYLNALYENDEEFAIKVIKSFQSMYNQYLFSPYEKYLEANDKLDDNYHTMVYSCQYYLKDFIEFIQSDDNTKAVKCIVDMLLQDNSGYKHLEKVGEGFNDYINSFINKLSNNIEKLTRETFLNN